MKYKSLELVIKAMICLITFEKIIDTTATTTTLVLEELKVKQSTIPPVSEELLDTTATTTSLVLEELTVKQTTILPVSEEIVFQPSSTPMVKEEILDTTATTTTLVLEELIVKQTTIPPVLEEIKVIQSTTQVITKNSPTHLVESNVRPTLTSFQIFTLYFNLIKSFCLTIITTVKDQKGSG